MTHLVARLGINLLLCSVTIPVIAAQSEQTSQPSAATQPPAATHAPWTIVQHGSSNAVEEAEASAVISGEQGAPVQNRLMLVTGEQMNEMSRRFKERLEDPEQRVALRAEQRAAVVSQNASVGRLVGLDPAMEQKLIELLTDQQMENLEQMHVRPRATILDLQKIADDVTARLNAVRDLLGDAGLERYQDFEKSQSGRYWVRQLSARLAPADQLQPDQEDRLTTLKQEQYERSTAALGWRAFRHPAGQPMSMEDLQRDAQRQARIENENSWRRRQVENRALEQKAAAFLTPVQLTELSRFQAQEQDNVRRYAEAARAEAGLDPKIPEKPEGVEETPSLVDALMQVNVRVLVNKEPTTVSRTVRNGESFTFEAAQGLIVEATPKMYGDDYIDVHLGYYEDGAKGRRRLSGGSISTTNTRQSDGSLDTGSGGGTVITGRKGYAVETTVNAKLL